MQSIDDRINEFLDKVIQGECIEVLKRFPDECIDYAYSDLPYNLKKYGKHPKDADNFSFEEDPANG